MNKDTVELAEAVEARTHLRSAMHSLNGASVCPSFFHNDTLNRKQLKAKIDKARKLIQKLEDTMTKVINKNL